MGSGKTAIVLGLILSTLHHLPILDRPSTYLDESANSPPPVILPDQSMRFPFAAEL